MPFDQIDPHSWESPGPMLPLRLEADVERINQFELYEIAKQLSQIAAYRAETRPAEAMWDVMQAETAIEKLMAGKPLPLGVSRKAALDVLAHVREIINQYYRGKNEKGEVIFKFPDENMPNIPEWTWDYYRTLLEKFETVFSAEMREAATYFVPRRGIFLTPALVDHASETFPAELEPFIPRKTMNDWCAAGRCLAFSLLSASGFHVARAVEGMLEAYFQKFHGVPGATLVSWYEYIKELKGIAAKNPDPCPSEKTIAELDQMKDDYRNPLMHPRVVLTEPDARMLFANGESLIMAMASELKAIEENKGGVQGALSTLLSGE